MKKARWIRAFCAVMVLLTVVSLLSGCMVPTRHDVSYMFADRYVVGNGSCDAENVDRIEINWVDGEITLVQGDDAEVLYTEEGTGLSAAQQMHTLLENGVLYIQYCESDYRGRIPGEQKNLTLTLPAGMKIDINNVSGTIRADGIFLGAARIDTVSAQVILGEVDFSSLYVYGVSGDLTADVLRGEEMYCSTASGALRVKDMQVERPWFESVSGSAEINSMCAADFEFYTTSGDVALTMLQDFPGSINTVSGNVFLSLPTLSHVTLRYESTSGEFTTQRECVMTERNKYSFGTGTAGMIAVATTSGSLSVD